MRLLGFVPFALFDGLVLADLVGDGSAACANSASDESALASAGETSDHSASGCRSANDLGSGVVAVVACGLFPLGSLMSSATGVVILRE